MPEVPTELPLSSLATPEVASSPIAGLAAHQAAAMVGTQIAQEVTKHPEMTSLWILPDDSYRRAREIYDLVNAQLRRFAGSLAEARKALGVTPREDAQPQVPAQPGGRTGEPDVRTSGIPLAATQLALSAAPTLFSLFQTNRTVRTGAVSVGLLTVAADVAHTLAQRLPRVNVTIAGVSGSSDEVLCARVRARNWARPCGARPR